MQDNAVQRLPLVIETTTGTHPQTLHVLRYWRTSRFRWLLTTFNQCRQYDMAKSLRHFSGDLIDGVEPEVFWLAERRCGTR